MTNLYGYAKNKISLESALNQFGPYLERAIGLFNSANACSFGKIDREGDRIAVRDGEGEIALEGIFEARVFDEASELRWLNDYGDVSSTDAQTLIWTMVLNG